MLITHFITTTLVCFSWYQLIDWFIMEAAQGRRLSVIASHLRQIPIPPTTTNVSSSIVSPSHCNSSDSEKLRNLEADCVFCKIIRGDAPALKVYLISDFVFDLAPSWIFSCFRIMHYVWYAWSSYLMNYLIPLCLFKCPNLEQRWTLDFSLLIGIIIKPLQQPLINRPI